MSICAGVPFLAQKGMLAGIMVTAHYGSLQDLKEVCEQHGGAAVVRQYYVDVGEVNGIHVIVSGGILSGFDATICMIETQFGFDAAGRSRATHGWNMEERSTSIWIRLSNLSEGLSR